MAQAQEKPAQKAVRLIYAGRSDIRRLTPTDLKRLGVDKADIPDSTLEFAKGVAKEVPSNLAEALVKIKREGFKIDH